MPQIYRAIRPMFKTDRWRICRDDFVVVLNGPEKGKTGKVLEVVKDKRLPQVFVEGCNMRKKKIPQGFEDDDCWVVTMEAPLHYSQVALCDPVTQKPFRAIYMFTADGKKVRARKVANPTTSDILPDPADSEGDPRAGLVGAKDTPAALARTATYRPADGFPFRPRNLERLWAELAPDAPPDGRDGGGDEPSAEVAMAAAAAAEQRWLPSGSIGGGGGARGLCSVAEAAAATVVAAAPPPFAHSAAGGFALQGLLGLGRPGLGLRWGPRPRMAAAASW